MAVIDTFLKLMVERGSEKLVLFSDRPPFLLARGEHIDLSMPGLGGEMLRRIAKEITGEKEENEGSFCSTDGVEFGYQIQADGLECRIEIHPLGSVSQQVSVDEDPLARAVADFTQSSAPPGITHACGDESSFVRQDPELVSLLDQALLQKASDLFLSSGKPPRIRRDGLICSIDAGAPGRGQILGLLPDDDARRELEESGSVDFAVRWELPDGPCRIRINVFRHLDGVAAALRPIRRRVPQLPELSLPEDLYQLATFPNGLVLVTGTAGSGKSTTLAAFVDHLNRTRPRHIITIEDPIEYEHREIK